MNAEKTSDLCGSFHTRLVCSSDRSHFNKTVNYSCDSADCPECWSDVIKNAALAVVDHLDAARVELRRHGLDPGHPYHFWISPPPDLYGLPLQQLRTRALKHSQDLGIIGGFIFDHPYRFKGKRGPYSEMERYRAGKFDTPYSPHFHVIGFLPDGFPTEKSNAFEKRTGWTYGNEGNRNKRGNPRNIYETAKYELSHCARETWHKHQMFKPFGILHSSKAKKIVDKAREIMKCPRCGEIIMRENEDGEILGPAHTRIRSHVELRGSAVPWLLARWPFLAPLFHAVHQNLTDLCRAFIRVNVQGVNYLGVEISSCELPEGAL